MTRPTDQVFYLGKQLNGEQSSKALRLIAMAWPQWACWVCAREQLGEFLEGPGFGSPAAGDAPIQIGRWCLFGFEGLIPGHHLPPRHEIIERLLQAGIDWDSMMSGEYDAHGVVSASRGRVYQTDEHKPSEEAGSLPWLEPQDPDIVALEGSDLLANVTFVQGWDSYWEQFGSGPYRGFHQPCTGYWLASDADGRPVVQKHLLSPHARAGRLESASAQALSLWALSASGTRRVVQDVSPLGFMSLLERDPVLAYRLMNFLGTGKTDAEALAAQNAFIAQQRAKIAPPKLPPLELFDLSDEPDL